MIVNTLSMRREIRRIRETGAQLNAMMVLEQLRARMLGDVLLIQTPPHIVHRIAWLITEYEYEIMHRNDHKTKTDRKTKRNPQHPKPVDTYPDLNNGAW